MYVVLLRYPSVEGAEPYRKAHQDFIAEGVARGDILISGPMEPRTGGVIVSTATTRADVDALIARDPYKRAGAATYEVIEFTARNGTVPELIVTAR